MGQININEVTHQWIVDNIVPSSVVVDATIGNGHDTLFLCDLAYYVYGFDVSKQALHTTSQKVKQYDNVQLICDSHTKLLNYIDTPIDGIVFNCGYLPNSNHSSVTKSETTIAALNNATQILKKTGWICITVYLGHTHGEIEAKKVLEWLQSNTKIEETYTYNGLKKAPIAYFARLK